MNQRDLSGQPYLVKEEGDLFVPFKLMDNSDDSLTTDIWMSPCLVRDTEIEPFSTKLFDEVYDGKSSHMGITAHYVALARAGGEEFFGIEPEPVRDYDFLHDMYCAAQSDAIFQRQEKFRERGVNSIDEVMGEGLNTRQDYETVLYHPYIDDAKIAEGLQVKVWLLSDSLTNR